ncbi:MAG TPA: sigma factor-like helix-turn-helix DNA-binding protein [Kofleriaceae bacterium]
MLGEHGSDRRALSERRNDGRGLGDAEPRAEALRKHADAEARAGADAALRGLIDAYLAIDASAHEEVEADEEVEAGDEVETDDELGDESAGVPAISRKVAARSRTKRDRPRSKTIALKRLTRAELARGAELYPPIEDVDLDRPQTRDDCRDAPRPCPWVACKHHLYLDINPRTGSIKINFPDLEPWELAHTCALDVADGGGLTLEEIGLITNLTRERVRQVEVRGLLTLRSRSNSLR